MVAIMPIVTDSPARRKLAVGYVVAMAALVANGIIAFWSFNSVRSTWAALAASRDFILGINEVLSDLTDAETGQRGYVLTGQEQYLEPYTKSHAAVPAAIDRLRVRAGENRSRQKHISAVADASAEKLAELDETIGLRRQGRIEAALAVVKTDRGKAAMDRVRSELGALRSDEDAIADALSARLQTAITRASIALGFASALAVALLLGIHLLSMRSHNQLSRQASWLATTLRSIGDAVIATDADGRVVFMNGVASTLTGWSQLEAVGRPLAEVFHIINEHTRSPVENPVGRAIERGTAVGLANHTVLIGRDGTEQAIEDTAAPIRADGGEVMGVILVFRPVGERWKLEKELHEKTSGLIKADRRKNEFLAMLAHELRNPLAAIRNAIHLLSDAEDAEWSKETIGRQVKHLARLVDDLLDVSRITHGQIELRKESIDASTVIQSAIEAVQPLVDARNQDLAVSYAPGTLWCEVDPTRLEQSLVNLLNNAVKYTQSGGHIHLSARRQGDHIAFTVKDDGLGIPPEKLSEIFELFAQGDRTIARSEGGLGIGLTVVKRIAELHGGSVIASSEGPGRGSEFTITLPALPRRAPLSARSGAPGQDRRNGARILVVDDHVDTARGLAQFLNRLGHDVRTAHDGHTAISLALALRPEFIVLDIGLPGIDGFQVARHVRGEGLRDTVIIAVSGYAQDKDRLRSKEAGFNYHLVKPVDHDLLLSLITQPASIP
jgi:PAS domain S-box-containing protein